MYSYLQYTEGNLSYLHCRNSDAHARNGRYSNINLMCSSYKRESEGGQTFSITSTKFSNSIPIAIRQKESESFKKAHY